MKIYELTFFENGHKYAKRIKADDIETAIEYAEIICDIPVGNITAVKEVK